MTIICSKVHSTEQFSYSPELRLFTTDASTLGPGALSRVYDDAIDEGFCLRSALTGTLILFVNDGVDGDRCGEDVAGWRFRADKCKRPQGQWVSLPAELQGITALVVNT